MGGEVVANENPYMNNQGTRRRGAHFAQPVEPVITYGEPPRRRRRRKWPIVLLLLALLAGGGYYGARKLGIDLPLPDLPEIPGISQLPNPVEFVTDKLGIGEKKIAITVDGEEVRVPEGSTIQDVFERVQPSVTAGRLMSVGGNALEEGEGEAYAATLDGAEVPYDEASSTVVAADASLSFADGADVTEDYTSEVTTTGTPKLVRKVKEGTTDAGYMVQQGVVQYVYQWGKPGTKEVRTGAVSGETVDGDVTETQDCIIMCQDIHPDNDEKLVALTFDDGPTYYTEQYLSILNQYGIKATFNMIGEQVEDYADVVRTNASSGNQLTSHTWHHPDLTTLGEDELRQQLGDTFDVIKRVADCDTTSIRAPYGDIDINVWLKSAGRMSLSIYWTHDSEDWKLPGVDTMVSYCTSNMAPGSVILMHDGGGNRDQDLEALPRIIEAWQNAGYRFVTIEELMASDSSIPEECCKNYRPMPEDAAWPTEIAEAAQVTDVG